MKSKTLAGAATLALLVGTSGIAAGQPAGQGPEAGVRGCGCMMGPGSGDGWGRGMHHGRGWNAGPGMGPGPGFGGGGPLLNAPIERIQSALGLDEAQVNSINEIRSSFQEDTQSSRDKIADLRQQMRALWTSGDVPDRDKVLDLQRKMRELRSSIAERAIDARIAILEILTPEQRKELVNLHGQRRGRHGRHGRHGGRGRRGPRR